MGHLWSHLAVISKGCGLVEFNHGARNEMKVVLSSISVVLTTKCARDKNHSGDVFIRTCI